MYGQQGGWTLRVPNKTLTQPTASSAQQQAYAYIHACIRDGRFAGGARIKPEEVASVLGLSRMPVREAIRQLDSEGLLTIRLNRGAVVTMLSSGELTELFEMRAVLEGLAMRTAVAAMDDDAFEEADLLLARMERARPDVGDWINRHEAFHDFLCRRSGRDRLIAEVARLRAAVAPYLRLSLHASSAAMDTAEHRLLVDVLRTGDPDRAEATMRNHVSSTAALLAHSPALTSSAAGPT